MDIRIGDTLISTEFGEIVLKSLLGQGGMGQVFKGIAESSQVLAVKAVLTSSLDNEGLKSLQNEAELGRKIEHENVVRILDFNSGENEEGIPPFLVLEFIDGTNLDSLIRERKDANSNLTRDELKGVFLQIARGMKAINEKLVHRDLKPANILVEKESGLLKIADFGLAKLADETTRSETFKGWGTRPYQAPEAFEFGPNTIAMDIYAAGVIFFELAALSLPIKPQTGDDSPLAWRNAHLLSPPLDLRTIRPDLGNEFVQTIALMLNKDPQKRPLSWDTIIDRISASGVDDKPNSPDVSRLLEKATKTFVETTAMETKRREEAEKRRERNALLTQAMTEPVELFITVATAFNEASDVAKLTIIRRDEVSAEISGTVEHKRLIVTSQIIDDLDSGGNGIFRILTVVKIQPPPTPLNEEEIYRNGESFGGFNLYYKVQNRADRFGSWEMIRFENNPLMASRTYPRWFPLDFADLPAALRILNGMSRHQNQRRSLDESWFTDLLDHLL